ncbi:MAG: hypothetical protein LBH37_04285, partial [Oscillospiraceae bacterium]|nr:hypothetical protein [Oscillospiraceae bacterium]
MKFITKKIIGLVGLAACVFITPVMPFNAQKNAEALKEQRLTKRIKRNIFPLGLGCEGIEYDGPAGRAGVICKYDEKNSCWEVFVCTRALSKPVWVKSSVKHLRKPEKRNIDDERGTIFNFGKFDLVVRRLKIKEIEASIGQVRDLKYDPVPFDFSGTSQIDWSSIPTLPPSRSSNFIMPAQENMPPSLPASGVANFSNQPGFNPIPNTPPEQGVACFLAGQVNPAPVQLPHYAPAQGVAKFPPELNRVPPQSPRPPAQGRPGNFPPELNQVPPQSPRPPAQGGPGNFPPAGFNQAPRLPAQGGPGNFPPAG